MPSRRAIWQVSEMEVVDWERGREDKGGRTCLEEAARERKEDFVSASEQAFYCEEGETSEGLYAIVPPGPMVEIKALEKQMAPKVGRETAFFATELFDQVASSASMLPFETWATSSSTHVFTLAHAAKKQVVGAALMKKRAVNEVGALVTELGQAKSKNQQLHAANKGLVDENKVLRRDLKDLNKEKEFLEVNYGQQALLQQGVHVINDHRKETI
uniref:Uncharacterized protein n=1 Tax=Cannabis sativa TaxID=3483 RepID=A0A803Q2V5_CANSA